MSQKTTGLCHLISNPTSSYSPDRTLRIFTVM